MIVDLLKVVLTEVTIRGIHFIYYYVRKKYTTTKDENTIDND